MSWLLPFARAGERKPEAELEEPVMEGLTRLVSESLARYGLDRPVDYRRLQWSRWFRCESLHSLLHVPSKPGIFAIAEEIMEFGTPTAPEKDRGHVGIAALDYPVDRSSTLTLASEPLGGAALQRCDSAPPMNPALAAEDSESRQGRNSLAQHVSAGSQPATDRVPEGRRMLSVLQFHEDDDMAYVLDRMLSRHNPMSARLASGKCFVRFVVIEDEIQRRSICNALNQWLVSTSETVTGIGAHFASSLEVVGRAPSPANADAKTQPAQVQTPELKEVKKDTRQTAPLSIAAHLDSGSAANIHCPQPLPSGF